MANMEEKKITEKSFITVITRSSLKGSRKKFLSHWLLTGLENFQTSLIFSVWNINKSCPDSFGKINVPICFCLSEKKKNSSLNQLSLH